MEILDAVCSFVLISLQQRVHPVMELSVLLHSLFQQAQFRSHNALTDINHLKQTPTLGCTLWRWEVVVEGHKAVVFSQLSIVLCWLLLSRWAGTLTCGRPLHLF